MLRKTTIVVFRQDCRCHGPYTNSGPPIQRDSVTVPSLSLPLVDNEFGRGRDGISRVATTTTFLFYIAAMFLFGSH